jgi:hypothetical protein
VGVAVLRVKTGRAACQMWAVNSRCGRASGYAYTIIECCWFAGVDPRAYLADVLPRLNRDGVTRAQLDALLPAKWLRARSS